VTKRQIRDTAALVERQDDSDRLLRTMKAASVWIEGLPEDLRDELASDDARVRQAAINDAIELTMAELERDSGKMISQETSDQIYLWLELMLKRRLEQSPQSAAMFEKLEERDPRRYAIFEHFLLRYLVDEPRSRGRGGGFGPRFAPPGFPRFGGPPPSSDAGQDGGPEAESRGDDGDAEGRDDRRSGGFPRIPPITDEELEELKNLLGPQALADLDAVTELFRRFLGEVAVHETLRTWATEAVRRNAPLVDAEEIDYLQRYLERDDRDVLDLSPPEAIRREVFERPRWYERPQRERRPRR
jgi:phosphoribosyl-ATP pyrophosphohydrolase